MVSYYGILYIFRMLTRIFTWTAYVMFMAAICVSRTFIATHFPHQVVAGCISGQWYFVIVKLKVLDHCSSVCCKTSQRNLTNDHLNGFVDWSVKARDS